MEPDLLLIILGIIVAAILCFTIFKGAIKMIVLAAAIICAVSVWIFLQRNGFTYLAFVTDSPQPWMVQILAWAAGLFVLMLFFHMMMWFSQLFSWKKKLSAGSFLTTIFMSALMLWVASVGVNYYGSISKIRYFHEVAKAQISGQEQPTMPWVTTASDKMRTHPWTSWITQLDPMDNKAQTNLACLVAFGCTLDEPTYTAFYQNQLANRNVPQSTRFLQLFGDNGLRTLVRERHFVTLLENEHLTTFLQFRNTAQIVNELL